MDYKYAYLLGNFLIILPLWLFIFVKRKDLRRKMIFVSVIGGMMALIAEYFYVKDYWRPMTVTGLPISIEDFLFGFLVTGVACSIYEEVFHYKMSRKIGVHDNPKLLYRSVLLGVYYSVIFLVQFLLLNISTMPASLIAFVLLAVLILYRRPDLTKDALLSGCMMPVFTCALYLLLFTAYPEIIDRFWLTNNLSGFRFLNIPVEEYLWFMCFGLSFGPIYEFLADRRIRRF